MKWIPINKKTGQRYPAISDEEKQEMEAYPSLSVNGIHKYRYEEVKGYEEVKEAPKPKEPIESKRTKK